MERIVLFPEHGDDVRKYETVPVRPRDNLHPAYGPDRAMLAHKPNGDCVYLGDHGCGIWSERPWLCRDFDCRAWFKKHTRSERRRMVRDKQISPDVVKAAALRLHTL